MDVNIVAPRGAVYRFDGFTLDLVRGALLAASGTEIALRPKAFALLRQLVENAGRLIDRDEIMAAVWPGVTVTDDSITQVIKEIRRALGDAEQRLLRTVPRRGVLFAAEVRRADDPASLVVFPAREPTPRTVAAAFNPASRPMLVVLPFANITGDPGQDYFADGISEDVMTALSYLRWFSVIARNSAFTFKGRAVDVREIGRQLGVGYVLEGSIRKSGERVRITARLCETEAGAQIWAGRFDGDLTDIFDLQDRLTEAVVGAIEPSLRLAEVARGRSKPTENLTAYDLYLRALPHRFITKEGSEEALRLLRRAIAIDPGFVAAKGTLAGLHSIRLGLGWGEQGDAEEATRLARETVEDAEEDAPSALACAGFALAAIARDYETGAAAVQRALVLAPNSGCVLLVAGWSAVLGGDGMGAARHLERAMRLSPADPMMFYFTAGLGFAKFLLRQYEAAAVLARGALADRPTYLAAHRLLVASLAQLGYHAGTKAALGGLLAVAPNYTIATARSQSGIRDTVLFEALHKAGLPE